MAAKAKSSSTKSKPARKRDWREGIPEDKHMAVAAVWGVRTLEGDKVTPGDVYVDIVQGEIDSDRKRQKLDAEIAKDGAPTKDKFDQINDALNDALSVFEELDKDEDATCCQRDDDWSLVMPMSDNVVVSFDFVFQPTSAAPEAEQKAAAQEVAR